MRSRILTVLLMIALCTVSAVFASAEDQRPYVEWLNHSAAFLTPQILGVEEGTSYAVYSAPYDNAWRDDSIQVTVASDRQIILLGYAHQGQWLWVEFNDVNGITHIGWVKAQLYSDTGYLFLPELSQKRLTKELAITAIPGDDQIITQLSAGDQVSLIKECYNSQTETTWLYVETTSDGQPLWGFIPNQGVETILPWHIEGDTLYIQDGITILGDLWLGYDPANPDDENSMSACADFDISDRACIELNSAYYDFKCVREVVIPETVRIIGSMAIYGLDLAELRLPGSVQLVSNVESLYSLKIDRLVLAKDYIRNLPSLDYTDVSAYEVEPGNPVYSSKDGVLFSADQKTLISYPSGSAAEHYDVPRGVERIGRAAFSSDSENVPLKTISLPIGLKEIDEYAFASLGRLISITIPPTVTKLASNAFAYCVSLERISLPEGLDISLNNWAVPGDFTYYNGDNGSPVSQKTDDEEQNSINRNANLISLNRSPVPVYRDAYTDIPMKMLPFGTHIYASHVENGRCEFYTDDYKNHAWVDIAKLQFACDDFYFRFLDADFEENRWTVEETGEPAKREMFNDVSLGDDVDHVEFYKDTFSDGIWQEFTLSLPLREATLYRSGLDDGRLLGYLDAGEMTEPVEVLDAPSGRLVGYQFPYTQAEVLGSASGWLLVRTAQYEGWVREELFITVYPKE